VRLLGSVSPIVLVCRAPFKGQLAAVKIVYLALSHGAPARPSMAGQDRDDDTYPEQRTGQSERRQDG
jgi:hypothetical protein